MSELRDQITEACEVISARWSTPPKVGLVLGTGLGDVAEQIETSAAIAPPAIAARPARPRVDSIRPCRPP